MLSRMNNVSAPKLTRQDRSSTVESSATTMAPPHDDGGQIGRFKGRMHLAEQAGHQRQHRASRDMPNSTEVAVYAFMVLAMPTARMFTTVNTLRNHTPPAVDAVWEKAVSGWSLSWSGWVVAMQVCRMNRNPIYSRAIMVARLLLVSGL